MFFFVRETVVFFRIFNSKRYIYNYYLFWFGSLKDIALLLCSGFHNLHSSSKLSSDVSSVSLSLLCGCLGKDSLNLFDSKEKSLFKNLLATCGFGKIYDMWVTQVVIQQSEIGCEMLKWLLFWGEQFYTFWEYFRVGTFLESRRMWFFFYFGSHF